MSYILRDSGSVLSFARADPHRHGAVARLTSTLETLSLTEGAYPK